MIVPTGISARLKDRRVDKILRKQGYDPAGCEIFYSPVLVWLCFWVLLLATFLPFVYPIFYLIYEYWLSCLIYFLLGYLVVAYLNNTFVFVEDKLLIINANFPFRRVVAYDLAEVKEVKIDHSRLLYPAFILGLLGRNYVEVFTEHSTERFYCTCLELDTYDENLTEKTIDDLHAKLIQLNIPTEFNLD